MIGGLLAVVVIAMLVFFWLLTRGPVAIDNASPAIKASFSDAFAPLTIDFIDPTLVWSGESRAFQFRVDQVEIFDAEGALVADVPRAEIGISADALLRGMVAPSRIEFIGATALLIRRQDGGLQLGLATPDSTRGARPGDGEQQSLGIVESILALLLEPPDRRSRGGYLAEFVIRDSTLRYFDAPSNSFWRAPDGFLSFGRGDNGLSLRLDADVEVGGRDWSLDIGGEYDPVAGRGAYTGTVLFYTSEYKEQRFFEPKSKVDMTLRVVTPTPGGFLDRMLHTAPAAITLQAEVPNYQVGALISGDTLRLKVKGGAGP